MARNLCSTSAQLACQKPWHVSQYADNLAEGDRPRASAGVSGDTNNITTHINIAAPNNDPKVIA